MNQKTLALVVILTPFISVLSLAQNPHKITKQFIAQYLPANPIIVEAGAHTGIDSEEMAKLWPTSMIYAFEPVPSLFEQLKHRASPYSNIVCSKKALSDKVGTTSMYVNEGDGYDGSSSLLKPSTYMKEDYPYLSFPHVINVETITLDVWAEQNNIDHVDFLWLDMQGAEHLMLKVAPKILSTVKVIYTEVSFREIYEGLTLYPEYQKWLESNGFTAIKYDEYAIYNKDGNVLFVRKN